MNENTKRSYRAISSATGRKKGLSLNDIAAVAGVSPATVSRVINNSGYVALETRLLVEQAVEQTGYVVNGAARALASRRTATFGALTPSFSSSISSQTIEGFQSEIERSGYVLLLADCSYDAARARRNAEAIVSRGVDGMFIISLQHDEQLYSMLRKQNTPFLTTMPNGDPEQVPFVGYDHKGAGRRIANFLLELGHSDIGLISTPPIVSVRLTERIAEMKEVVLSGGGVIRDEMAVEVDSSTLASGRDALRRIQARGPLPSAIIATNDTLAAGILMECMRQGIRVPEDLSIVGYGDMDMASHMTPAITTIRTPKREIGELAAQFLLNHIEGVLPSRQLPFELVVRETTSRVSERSI